MAGIIFKMKMREGIMRTTAGPSASLKQPSDERKRSASDVGQPAERQKKRNDSVCPPSTPAHQYHCPSGVYDSFFNPWSPKNLRLEKKGEPTDLQNQAKSLVMWSKKEEDELEEVDKCRQRQEITARIEATSMAEAGPDDGRNCTPGCGDEEGSLGGNVPPIETPPDAFFKTNIIGITPGDGVRVLELFEKNTRKPEGETESELEEEDETETKTNGSSATSDAPQVRQVPYGLGLCPVCKHQISSGNKANTKLTGKIEYGENIDKKKNIAMLNHACKVNHKPPWFCGEKQNLTKSALQGAMDAGGEPADVLKQAEVIADNTFRSALKGLGHCIEDFIKFTDWENKPCLLWLILFVGFVFGKADAKITNVISDCRKQKIRDEKQRKVDESLSLWPDDWCKNTPTLVPSVETALKTHLDAIMKGIEKNGSDILVMPAVEVHFELMQIFYGNDYKESTFYSSGKPPLLKMTSSPFKAAARYQIK
jgi:hypothetical protein